MKRHAHFPDKESLPWLNYKYMPRLDRIIILNVDHLPIRHVVTTVPRPSTTRSIPHQPLLPSIFFRSLALCSLFVSKEALRNAPSSWTPFSGSSYNRVDCRLVREALEMAVKAKRRRTSCKIKSGMVV